MIKTHDEIKKYNNLLTSEQILQNLNNIIHEQDFFNDLENKIEEIIDDESEI
jgi:hypothetical protein